MLPRCPGVKGQRQKAGIDAMQLAAEQQADTIRAGAQLHRRYRGARRSTTSTGPKWRTRRLQRDRIAFYNERVREASVILAHEYDAEHIEDGIWQQIKLHFIGLLIDHRQPECAETFFNSVRARSCTARTSTTASSSCARRSPPSTSRPTRPPIAATTRRRMACAMRWSTSSSISSWKRASPTFAATLMQRLARVSKRARRAPTGSTPTTRSRCCRRCSSATRPPMPSGAW